MNILIIENSPTLSQLLQKALESYRYNTTLDDENFQSKSLISKKIFDFVILNTNMGKELTVEILDYIKKTDKDTKVLGVCNKGSWVEKVDFLNHGGDDVLTYPFPVQELLARIQSLIRRPKSYVDENLYLGDYVLDTKNRVVTKDEKDINLRKKEYSLFEYLARNKNRAISRCELLDHVWDYREYVGSNTIDVHIKRLRDKLEDKNLINTIHGVGYKIKAKKPKAS
ncbi:MAG: two component transcriptional regulator, winged helix family protein [candidate division WS6 bacterium GW2011_GWC1_36_11]|uniref:Two component transcriptional regulator, winged helix family protein n=2 Tax=Candidatus Dojkabacteria TaxID=74243 RepID=A0A0G0DRL8_9BACT|nr:MAG: two component transcriptional regulator, winged helix family protein [candidate division WS6 bacterium GW2011_GWC1_36_11]KKQ04071.1 MAG: Two-component system signal transduction response regulator [candidate division WS6 bacterium GW2011_WS6_36_26]KKQ10887.1 MAG: Two-component system signal transduction response regulator [candidate division WS6 bacterium GW2011_GWE1_36_69]KKQ11682.1 MAG: Two-component system signal transduction response regulator [candidate division WS6 bacterium GW2011